MDNSEFRKYLEDARKAASEKAERGSGDGANGEDRGGGVHQQHARGPKKKSKGSARYQRMIEMKQREKEKEEEDGKYRDRAEERRKEINPDYTKDTQQYMDVDIEQSKFLGGDVEHTHLVKGLDFALLNKVRGEMERGEEGSVATQIAPKVVPKQGPKASKSSHGKSKTKASKAHNIMSTGSAQPRAAEFTVRTRTNMGKALAYFVMRSQELDQAATRTQRVTRKTAMEESLDRLSFEYDLSSTQYVPATEIPTMVSRPKLDARHQGIGVDADDDAVLALVQPALIDRAVVAFAKRKAGKKAKKRGRESLDDRVRQASRSKVEPKLEAKVDMDFDIFADAGSYSAEVALGGESRAATTTTATSGGGGGGVVGDGNGNEGGGGIQYFTNLRAKTSAEEAEEAREREERAANERSDVKNVKGLAAVWKKIEARRNAKAKVADDDKSGHSLSSAGEGYGEAHDYDFDGRREDAEEAGRERGRSNKKARSDDGDGAGGGGGGGGEA